MKLNLLRTIAVFALIQIIPLFGFSQKNYGDRVETAQEIESNDMFRVHEEKSNFDPEEQDSPLEYMRNQNANIVLDQSVFDKKKDNERDAQKDGLPPDVPISDHLHWLALGGILIFAWMFKKKLLV